jgi:PAS domain S-box-containing protein
MHGAIQDITERKMNLEAIQNERTLLRTLIDNLPVSIYVKDAQCRKVVANLTDVENMGYALEKDVLGKTDLELFDGEDGERGYRDDLAVIQTGEPVINRERSFSDPKGTIRWSLTSKLPLFDRKGKVSGLVGISRDITEQKRSLETIQKLSKSIEQSPSIVMITDIYGNIEYVNPKFTEVTGYTSEEIIGQNPRFLKSGEMPSSFYEELWRSITSGGVWRGEFHNRKKNGELYWEWATITSIKNENDKTTNYIAIKEDISLRKQMEAELIIAKEKAEESDRLKSAFLANMSHEIRTPLNSIIGFSELLTDSAFEDDQKTQFIETIIANGNNLLNIISDIVDISKIEAGEITIRNSKIQVKHFLDEIMAMHLMTVEGKKLQFNQTYDESLAEKEYSVFADKERLQQIFNNLISNALKFTSEGFIEIGCRLVDDRIEFHVTDTGIGIPPEFHNKIFDRFRQVEASYTRKFGGNGLGLAISKNLIELMGGKIWVESEMGKGATFYFTLPISIRQ